MSSSPAVGMFYVFRYEGAHGPFFCGGFETAPAAIARAKQARSGSWSRTIVRNVRSGLVVWDSDEPNAWTGPLITNTDS